MSVLFPGSAFWAQFPASLRRAEEGLPVIGELRKFSRAGVAPRPMMAAKGWSGIIRCAEAGPADASTVSFVINLGASEVDGFVGLLMKGSLEKSASPSPAVGIVLSSGPRDLSAQWLRSPSVIYCLALERLTLRNPPRGT